MHLRRSSVNVRSVGIGVAEELFQDGLCLPSGSNLTEGDLSRVVGVVRRMRIDGKCCMPGYEKVKTSPCLFIVDML